MSDLHELFENDLGDGPAHRPTADRLRAGRTAVRRRRLAEVGAGAGVAAVVVVAGLVVGGTGRPGATDDAPDVTSPSSASAPSALASDPGWANDELARFTDGDWEVRPDAQVLDHIDNPLQRRGVESSEAFAVTWQDEETWLLVDHTLDRRGRSIDSVSSFPARVAMPDLASWVEQMVALQRGESARLLVRFADGETLTPGDGATILDQRAHPDLPASFAGPDDRTAVAKVRFDDRVWFVLARQIGDTPPDYIPTAASIAGPGIDDFLAYAAQQYAGGEGLR